MTATYCTVLTGQIVATAGRGGAARAQLELKSSAHLLASGVLGRAGDLGGVSQLQHLSKGTPWVAPWGDKLSLHDPALTIPPNLCKPASTLMSLLSPAPPQTVWQTG